MASLIGLVAKKIILKFERNENHSTDSLPTGSLVSRKTESKAIFSTELMMISQPDRGGYFAKPKIITNQHTHMSQAQIKLSFGAAARARLCEGAKSQ